MHPLIIEPRRCPRRDIRRTTRLPRSSTAFCFSCRLLWDCSAETASVVIPTYSFTTTELRRLTAYRLAVEAGFLSDWW
jgi:hypothetical protein